jgi:hypothetical protein
VEAGSPAVVAEAVEAVVVAAGDRRVEIGGFIS